MTSPRETARQIAERTDLLVEQHTASPLIAYRDELVAAIEAHVASLTAALAQARQEIALLRDMDRKREDAFQRAIEKRNEVLVHLRQTKQQLTEAVQARAAALAKGADIHFAAGFLLKLKAECEAQHARAEQAEAQLAEAQQALTEARKETQPSFFVHPNQESRRAFIGHGVRFAPMWVAWAALLVVNQPAFGWCHWGSALQVFICLFCPMGPTLTSTSKKPSDPATQTIKQNQPTDSTKLRSSLT